MAAPVSVSTPADSLHEQVLVETGRRTGVTMVIAIHSTALGPALGGVRLWHYPTDADGIRDALRLSRGMTFKAAAAGLDLGGGKGVICAPAGAAP
ncbi:MAG: Glu/Leu/Phe/Val dehydrogenase dimerization domain-containing protein, partial [Solirubrobacterales bacterium]